MRALTHCKHPVQLLFSAQQVRDSYTPPDKRSVAEGHWSWLPHHTQQSNELLLSSVLYSVGVNHLAEPKTVHCLLGTPQNHHLPLDLYYRRFFHPAARALWTPDSEPPAEVLAFFAERYAGLTGEEPILIMDEDDAWIENEQSMSGPKSFMERAHHHLRWSKWLSRKASADHDGNVRALGEPKVDIRGEVLRADRPPFAPFAQRLFYGACEVRGTVYSVGDYAQLNPADTNFPPPYIARIERIYKVVYKGKSDESASNDWEVDLYWMWTLPQTFLSGIPADRIACRGAPLSPLPVCAIKLIQYTELVFSVNLREERVPQGALLSKVTVRHLSEIGNIRGIDTLLSCA